MLSTILVLIAIAIIIVCTLAAMQPDDFRITRSATVAAPPEKAFALVNDFHRWHDWSPWAKRDPNCKNAFAGEAAGQGAIFSWDGNNKVGAGRMTITGSRPPEHVVIQLEFLKPFKAVNTAEFTFKLEAEQTVVTWSMTGKNNFPGKIFSLFIKCDQMIGKDFETGLAAMKAIAEGK